MTATLAFRGVSKSFPGVRALDKVSFEVRAGQVTSLLGENGAGKSTLLSILGGAQLPDEGEVLRNGTPTHLGSPRDATAAGIQIVRQEPHLAPGLSVAENILLGGLPARLGIVRKRDIESRCREVTERLGLDVDLSAKCGYLGVAQRQIVEIVKALVHDVAVLALDEPTSSLADAEVEQLFSIIRNLRDEGVALIYVSHRMDEVLELSDSYVVLRDGKVVGERAGPDVREDELIRLMIGRDLEDVFDRKSSATSNVVLRLEEYETDQVGPLSMEVRAGEVVGIAGLVGSGRSRLIRAIGGVDAGTAGRMMIKGRAVSLRGSADAIASGIAMCPEDRKKLALFPDRSVAENMQIGVWSGRFRNLLQHPRKERRLVTQYIEQLGIRPADPKRPVRTLSGGNAQKVVLARSLALRPNILLLDEPTRGIDVGAKSDIYRIIRDLASQGVAVVITSSELIEVLGLSDRIYVMRAGAISGSLSAEEATEESLMRLAIATQPQDDRKDTQ